MIGHPTSDRVVRFQAALVGAGQEPARVVGYADLIAGRVALPEVVRAGAVVRIDSPDRDFAVEREILALGAEVEDSEGGYQRASRAEIAALGDEAGAIRFPRQWYLGYREVLRRIARQLDECAPHRLMNHPDEIATMFDKRACHALLAGHGVAVPRALGPVGSYEELIARMREARMSRVFVKLAHGSSASGVVAYQVAGERHQAMTTVEMVRSAEGVRLFNNRRVRVYRDRAEIAALIDALCLHRVQVEQWIPKAGFEGRTLDLRVVVIGGAARHVVVRLSRHAMTNLHLSGGRTRGRMPLEGLEGRLSPAAWAAARETCERAMGLFPRSLYAGIDLLIASDFRRHAIAEVNAFGDLLFNVWYEGRDAFGEEIRLVMSDE
ncbi:MAG: STM4014 family protein [Chloroflexia bacterium]